MANDQTVLFTVLPRGLQASGDILPMSIYVAPRLRGEDQLGAFPDWLDWTTQLKQRGLTLDIHCNGKSFQASINTDVLRPDLWEQLFSRTTFVRSRKFDDYTGHGIISYPVRATLSALKGIYQDASLTLALPNGNTGDNRERRNPNRARLSDLVKGLQTHFNGDVAAKWREDNRSLSRPQTFLAGANQGFTDGAKDDEGLLIGVKGEAAFQFLAKNFSVFHRMPTPDSDKNPLILDREKQLDFHQVLSSLNAYPELLRALGLVFDIDLPVSFVDVTPANKPGSLSVHGTNFPWETPIKTPELSTAYLHFLNGRQRFFFAAPRVTSDSSSPTTVLGLLILDANRFGVTQVDVDGGMHKAIYLAETLHHPEFERNTKPNTQPGEAPNPEIFDPGATLPSLRSVGFSLFADRRGLALFDTLSQGKIFNDAVEGSLVQPRPLFAEDLVRGFRVDVWDSHTTQWHSLHRRSGDYQIGEKAFQTREEEGFIQTGAAQPAPGAQPTSKDLYLHEAFARWGGWSLSAPFPGKALSRFADPAKAIPPDGDDPDYRVDQPETPFKMTVKNLATPGSLPSLRFGRRYRFRARAVDLAGNSLKVDDPIADLLARPWGLPLDPEGIPYLRYEPVAAPIIVIRDSKAVTEPGSAQDRIVIRTFNDKIGKDSDPAMTDSADRHLLPPRTSVEIGEHQGMFDDATKKIKSDPATYQLISDRDAGELTTATITIAGKSNDFPLVATETVDELSYLPDAMSRGVAIRDLPGTPEGSVGKAVPGAGMVGAISYSLLSDSNPRPGSATLLSFGESGEWEKEQGVRMALAEPTMGQDDLTPTWDPDKRLLTTFLSKGMTKTVPISSYMTPENLHKMGIWKWMREVIEGVSIFIPIPEPLILGLPDDGINHILQRTVEGGHWMLTPPRLVTLVHAVQQPIGKPEFISFPVGHESGPSDFEPLLTAPIANRSDTTELEPVTAFRRPGSTDAYLIGALKVHGASTAKVDLSAEWTDPVDDLSLPTPTMAHHKAHVDEIPLTGLQEGYLRTTQGRGVGYYDPEHDQIGFVREGDFTGQPVEILTTPDQFPFFEDEVGEKLTFFDAAPQHALGDTRRHRVSYTATATSRYREYFPQDVTNGFNRESDPILVDVPASERPVAPEPAFVLPTFGWQRQTDTNMKRSVRFGGGLRVYLQRPWFSSGEGELLGVTLWSFENGSLDAGARVKFKPYITQWGMDPIWETGNLGGAPATFDFPDSESSDFGVTLEERNASVGNNPGKVDVVGFPVTFDETRKMWYADLTINLPSATYSPFVRLALTRYQPHALPDAKISRVVLADFAQLTPFRAALVTADPFHPKTLRVTVSGVAPRGPNVEIANAGIAVIAVNPTRITVKVQQRDPLIQSDLGWNDVLPAVATVVPQFDGLSGKFPDITLWTGLVTFATPPVGGEFRLVIEEHEFISADSSPAAPFTTGLSGRLIYAEVMPVDAALVSP